MIVRTTDDGSWWRGWWHNQELVVISSDADIEVEAGDAEEVRILGLPGDGA